jgi:hypothetical protein
MNIRGPDVALAGDLGIAVEAGFSIDWVFV